ncbi:MAG TPA: tetratricopeptide repeat protein [Pyrinomonadaceae bacterium]|nr:tetratricopeptide repeat protein [Pyrinomonadaceae bacterium]
MGLWNRVRGWFSVQPTAVQFAAAQPEGAEIEKFFTDTEELIRTLKDLAKSERSQKRIFIITGVGGVGKTSVLTMVRLFCNREGVAAAYVSGSDITTPVDVLRTFVKELKAYGVEFPRFDKTFKQYLSIHVKAEAEAKSYVEKQAALAKTGIAAGAKVAAYVLPGGKLAEDLGVPIASAVVDLLAEKFTEADYRLYLESTQKLTEVFLDDLADMDPPRRVVLMLNTYEQMAGLDKWVRDLLRKMRDNVLVVIAGKTEVGRQWDEDWPGWQMYAWWPPAEMESMSDEHLRTLAERYHRTISSEEPDPKTVEEIVRFARGLPMAVTVAVQLSVRHKQKDFRAIRPEVMEDLHARLMEGIPTKLRKTLEEAATLRWFDKEMLRFMAGTGDDAPYEELKQQQSFLVRSHDGKGWQVHERMRETINNFLKSEDHARYRGLHEKAAEYFKQRLDATAVGGPATTERRHEILPQITYHQFQVSEEAGLAYLAQVFESELFNRRQIIFCQSLLEEVRAYDLTANARNWLKYYGGVLAFYEGSDRDRPREILEELSQGELDERLKVNVLEELAGVYWFYSLRVPNATERAEELYGQCLEIRSADPRDILGQARILTWLGILHQRTKGTGEKDFRQALELITRSKVENENFTAWLERELSISLRMQGKFDKSRELVTSSIEKFEKSGLKMHKAHSLLNYGMLLLFMGRLKEAEDQIKQCVKLYQASGRPQTYEKAWPLIGLGDVALGRGQDAQALAHYEEALKTWEGDDFGTAVACGSIAEVHLARGAWDLAVENADRSLVLKRGALKDKFGLGWTLNVKGKALMGKKQDEEAWQCFREGYQHMADYGSHFGKSRLALSLCGVCLRRRQAGEFQKWATEVETAGTLDNYFHDLAQVSFLRGVAELELNGGGDQPPGEGAERRVAEHFLDALTNALQHNTYFLDSMLQRVIAALEPGGEVGAGGGAARGAIYRALLEGWKTGRLKNSQLTTAEAERSREEGREAERQETVVRRLQKQLEAGP